MVVNADLVSAVSVVAAIVEAECRRVSRHNHAARTARLRDEILLEAARLAGDQKAS